MTHRIVIPAFVPTSTNALLRVGWQRRRRMKKSDAQLIGFYARAQAVPRATGKRRVSLDILYTGTTPFDEDNLFKSLLDALVTAGLLVDDSPAWCERGAVKQAHGKARQTVIVLEDVGP